MVHHSLLVGAVVALMSGAPARGAQNLVTPGLAAGPLRLGATRASIRQVLGKPAKTFKTHGGCTADWWETPNGQVTEVVYRSDRALQIAVASKRFATQRGVSTNLPYRRLRRAYPRGKRTTYLFDTNPESGKGLEYYDDVRRGIAFVFYAPTNHDPASTGIDSEKPWLLVVHERGRPAVPTVGQGIEDLNNQEMRQPARAQMGTSSARLGAGEERCRTAVQGFYDWYVKLDQDEVPGGPAACIRAIKLRPQWFSAAVRGGLLEDAAAQAKSKEYIVGLDADPFVRASDPAPRYVAKKVTRRGSRYRVLVHPVYEGGVNARAGVIPELEFSHGQWVFVNFHYPADDAKNAPSSLLQELRELREDRKKGSL
jgi:hypothetical protein